jgi:8-oxo-dGTP diphosphatase
MTDLMPVPGAGVVCVRDGQVLLIRRATPPLQGQWSLPGGKIGWGETARDAALRELREEAGVEAEIVGLIDVVDAIFPMSGGLGSHYVLVDYAARWLSGEPKAGDDASEAAFFPLDEAIGRVGWSETRRIIQAGAALVQHNG